VRQDGAFANLRLNPVWRRWPEKCFVYHETYNPPTLLHGICSSIPQWKNWFGRFRSFGYPLLTHLCPNPVPDGLFGIKEPKRYLFSFVGRWSHAVRRRLFAHSWPDDVFVRCSHDTYSRFIRAPEKDSRAEEVRYWQTMAASKFALCPRGAGVSSIRLFEALHRLLSQMDGCLQLGRAGIVLRSLCPKGMCAISQPLFAHTKLNGRNEEGSRMRRTMIIFGQSISGRRYSWPSIPFNRSKGSPNGCLAHSPGH
jgi:hypothetical protein